MILRMFTRSCFLTPKRNLNQEKGIVIKGHPRPPAGAPSDKEGDPFQFSGDAGGRGLAAKPAFMSMVNNLENWRKEYTDSRMKNAREDASFGSKFSDTGAISDPRRSEFGGRSMWQQKAVHIFHGSSQHLIFSCSKLLSEGEIIMQGGKQSIHFQGTDLNNAHQIHVDMQLMVLFTT